MKALAMIAMLAFPISAQAQESLEETWFRIQRAALNPPQSHGVGISVATSTFLLVAVGIGILVALLIIIGRLTPGTHESARASPSPRPVLPGSHQCEVCGAILSKYATKCPNCWHEPPIQSPPMQSPIVTVPAKPTKNAILLSGKVCQNCNAIAHGRAVKCPNCRHAFPPAAPPS